MKRLLAWARAPFFSPAGFLVRAAALTALYALATLLGLRGHATVLSGGLPYEGASPRLSSALGLGYVLLHLSWVLGAPVLVLAAGFLRLARPLLPPDGGAKTPPA